MRLHRLVGVESQSQLCCFFSMYSLFFYIIYYIYAYVTDYLHVLNSDTAAYWDPHQTIYI